MKYCSNCGASCEDNAKFCKECGTPCTASTPESNSYTPATSATSTENSADNQSTSGSYSYSYGSENNSANSTPNNNSFSSSVTYSGIAQRNIAIAIILTIVTCGLYGIYWMIKLNDEINILAGEPAATSGGMVFLFTLITCGIYGIFWYYKMGERCDRIKGTDGSSHIVFLVLGLFGFGIISYCLMQDTINKAV